MEISQRFTTPMGTYVQIKWDGDPQTLRGFLSVIGVDLLNDGWGYDPNMKSVMVPGNRAAFVGEFITCAYDRRRDAADAYSVNNLDLNDILRKL